MTPLNPIEHDYSYHLVVVDDTLNRDVVNEEGPLIEFFNITDDIDAAIQIYEHNLMEEHDEAK